MKYPAIPTKSDFLNALGVVQFEFLVQLERIYGPLSLVDPASNKLFDSYARQEHKQNIHTSSDFERLLGLVFDYATTGIFDTTLRDQWEVLIEDYLGFIDGLRNFPLLANNTEYFPINKVTAVLDLFMARMNLDAQVSDLGSFVITGQDHITTDTLATLAGISEKTILNLLSTKSEKQIPAFKEDGKAVIRAEDALEWLLDRGYQPIKIKDATLLQDLDRGFYGQYNMADYFWRHIEAVTDDDAADRIVAVVKKAELPLTAEPWLRALIDQGGTALPTSHLFNPEWLFQLATVFGLKKKPFAAAVMKQLNDNTLELFNKQ